MRPGASPMTDMLRHAKRLQKVESEFRSLLPENLAEHVRVANQRDGELVLVTPVAPIGARLRMEAAQIPAQLAQRGIRDVNRVSILVRPFPVEHHDEPQRRELSPAAKQALKAMGVDPEK